MKKKKLTSLDILDGKVGKNATLSRSEMKNIMAGSGSQCNCLYCQMSNGGLNTYAADCATNPPNYPSLYCFWFTGDPGVNGSYGIC